MAYCRLPIVILHFTNRYFCVFDEKILVWLKISLEQPYKDLGFLSGAEPDLLAGFRGESGDEW